MGRDVCIWVEGPILLFLKSCFRNKGEIVLPEYGRQTIPQTGGGFCAINENNFTYLPPDPTNFNYFSLQGSITFATMDESDAAASALGGITLDGPDQKSCLTAQVCVKFSLSLSFSQQHRPREESLIFSTLGSIVHTFLLLTSKPPPLQSLDTYEEDVQAANARRDIAHQIEIPEIWRKPIEAIVKPCKLPHTLVQYGKACKRCGADRVQVKNTRVTCCWSCKAPFS